MWSWQWYNSSIVISLNNNIISLNNNIILIAFLFFLTTAGFGKSFFLLGWWAWWGGWGGGGGKDIELWILVISDYFSCFGQCSSHWGPWNTRIFNGCEVRIENFFTRVTGSCRHHEACLTVISSSRIVNHTKQPLIMRFFFLHTLPLMVVFKLNLH